MNETAVDEQRESQCDDKYMLDIQNQCMESADLMNDIRGLVACKNIHPFYTDAVYDSVCGDLVEGMMTIWVIQVVTTFMLWVAYLMFPVANFQPRSKRVKIEQVYASELDNLEWELNSIDQDKE